MRLRRAVVAAALLTSHLTLGASPPATLKLVDLYKEAQIVGVVEILEGKLVSPGDRWCGARYKGRVVDGVKNAAAGTTLEFGYLPHLKIGTAYLLVLGRLEAPPPIFQSEDDFLNHCRPQLPGASILGLWRGAMEVEGDTRDRAKRTTWTVQPVGHVAYPLGTRSTKTSGERRLWYADLVKRLEDGQ